MGCARLVFAFGVTAVMLAGCGVRTGALSLGAGMFGGGSPDAAEESTSAIPVAPLSSGRMSVAAVAKPVDAYVMLGGRIKTCWFNADAPLLPNHVYRADVSPDGDKVQITIHQKIELGRAGARDLRHRFQPAGHLHGGDDPKSQHAARARRQDAIRHRPLEARRDELQQRDAEGYRSRSRPALAFPHPSRRAFGGLSSW